MLFVTLTTSGYEDRFLANDRFVWSSQNSVGPEGKKGKEILNALDTGTRIHLFVRVKKTDVAFEYCGRVAPVDHHGDHPMSVNFRLLSALSPDAASRLVK